MTLAHPSRRKLLRWCREVDQRRAAVQVPNAHPWPPLVLTQLEGETTPHPSSSQTVSDGDAGEVERQVQADARAPQVVGVGEEDCLDEVLRCSHDEAMIGSVGLESCQLRD